MSHSYKGISNVVQARSKIMQPFCYWLDVFSEQELVAIEELMSKTPLVDSMISGAAGTVDTNVRRSKVSFHNYNDTNGWIFDRLNQIIDNLNNRFYNFDLNGYDGLQYGEYHSKDQGKYDWHMDMYLGHMPESDFETRKLSLTLMLNDDYEGGDFELIHTSLSHPVKIDKQRGKLLLFPSFLFHRVTPVTQGIRKSMVAWVVGPKFR
jgi:PKHD-type hydroxylase